MRAFRHILSAVLILLMTVTTVGVPASAFAAVGKGQAASSDCHCPKSDCAKNAPCANEVCASICANLMAGAFPEAQWLPVFAKAETSDRVERAHTALDRPPPLPPPRS